MYGFLGKPAFKRLMNILQRFPSDLRVKVVRDNCGFCTCVCLDLNVPSCNLESNQAFVSLSAVKNSSQFNRSRSCPLDSLPQKNSPAPPCQLINLS